ncbi:hypothetical protein [Nocardia sp. NPDC127526]|uniref:hypothetical protein n=1 Tax=Nocardia sp. NPDC127526 TaxID=3345393 RepID=UPI0036382B1F
MTEGNNVFEHYVSGSPPPEPRRWLWTVGAVILTAAVWAGVLVAVGRPDGAIVVTPVDSPSPVADLRGYHAVADLCANADLLPVTAFGFAVSNRAAKNPKAFTSNHPVVDTMECRILLEWPTQQPGSLTNTQLDIVARLHKQVNPAAEFSTAYRSTTEGQFGLAIPQQVPTRVAGMGEDAYQLVQSTTNPDRETSVQLWIRDGWMVYGVTWHQAVDAVDTTVPVLDATNALAMLRKLTEGTLPRLRV